MTEIALEFVAPPLAFFSQGRGSPVLLIHGLGSSSRDWALQVEALRKRHRVITVDLPGHGDSEAPAGALTMQRLGADVATVLRSAGATPAHVVGLSLGGMVAFQLAVDAPELVRSLVIVNSGPEVVPRNTKDRARILFRLTLSRFLSMRQLGKLLGKRLFPHAGQAALRHAFVARFAENHKPSYNAALRAIVGWSVLDRVGEIACPTLVISGDRDYTSPEDKGAYVRLMPRARLEVIEDSGHATPVDRPGELNDVLLRFLAGVEAGSERAEEVA